MVCVRCPLTEMENRSKQLRKFSDHLSRLIQSEACAWRPQNLAELMDLIDKSREELFLDGPSGFDWIFRNSLLQDREGTMYVDYVETDADRRWDAPNEALAKMLTMGGLTPPGSLTMARHLSKVGTFTEPGMAIVAAVWRGTTPTADMGWGSFRKLNLETLEPYIPHLAGRVFGDFAYLQCLSVERLASVIGNVATLHQATQERHLLAVDGIEVAQGVLEVPVEIDLAADVLHVGQAHDLAAPTGVPRGGEHPGGVGGRRGAVACRLAAGALDEGEAADQERLVVAEGLEQASPPLLQDAELPDRREILVACHSCISVL